MIKKFFLLLPLIISGNTFSMMWEWKHEPKPEKNDPFNDSVLSARPIQLAKLCAEPELKAASVVVIGKLDTEEMKIVDFLVQQTRLNDRVQVDKYRYNDIVKLDTSIKNCFSGKKCFVAVDLITKIKRVGKKSLIGAGALGTAGFVVGGIVGGYTETSQNNQRFLEEVKSTKEKVYSGTFNKEYQRIHAEEVFKGITESDCYATTASRSFIEWAPSKKYGEKSSSSDINDFGKYLGEQTKELVKQERAVTIENRSTILEIPDYFLGENVRIEDVQMTGDGRGTASHIFERWGDSVRTYCAAKYDTPEVREFAQQEAISLAQTAAQVAVEKLIQPATVNFSLENAKTGGSVGLVLGGVAGAAHSICFTDDLTRPKKEREIPRMIKQI